MSESQNSDDDHVLAYQVPVNVPFILNDFQPVHLIPDLMEEDMEMLLNIPGMRARIGLNETTLTRALGRGDFALAERIIEEATDPEFLNDGALAATPLNIVLSGRSSFFHQPRNLKLALLLLLRGANPNLRIPNHDMESASEAPLELLLRYYLRLLEVFGSPGHCRTSYRPSSMEETELMDTVGLHGELGGLGPMQMVAQTRQLLIHFLENGGDTNLPTTDAAKTIYHMAVTATVPDKQLVIRMVELGAAVNSADLHNTTPLMDVVMIGSEERCCDELDLLQRQGKTLLLDTQNCSLQSVLWRAMFQGHGDLSRRLLTAGASGGSSARVERVTGSPIRPSFYFGGSQINPAGVPTLLAPLLNDSPCTSQLHANFPKHRNGRVIPQFSLLASLHCIRTHLSPLVDCGNMSSSDTAVRLGRLVRGHTSHATAADDNVVDPLARVQLMYGQMTAGLRQLAVRAILKHTLFTNKNASDTLNMMEELLKKKGVATMRVEPSATKIAGSATFYEYELSNSGLDYSSSGSESDKESSLLKSSVTSGEVVVQSFVEPNSWFQLEKLSDPSGEIITLGNPSQISGNDYEDPNDSIFIFPSTTTQEIIRECDALEEEIQGTLDVAHGDQIHQIMRECDALEEEIQGTLNLSLEPENMRLRRRLLSEASQLNNLPEFETTEHINDTPGDSSDQTVPDITTQLVPLKDEILLHHSNDVEELETQKETAIGEGRRTMIDENWSLGSLGELELIGICDNPNDSEESATKTCDSSQNQGALGTEQPDLSPITVNIAGRRMPGYSGGRMPDLVASSDSETEEWNSPSSNPPSPPTNPPRRSTNPPRLISSPPGAVGDRRGSVDSLLFNFKLSDTSAGSAPDLTLTSDSDQDSLQSSDTWGGTFSLSCTKKHREETKEVPPGDSTIVSKLTARTLSALADRLEIPGSLRPCFSIEAARLQVCLLLFNHQSITCDRNCEGDESDSDSEDDWLATDTEHVSDTDTGGRDSDSSDSHFSLRSWFGSTQDGSEGPESSMARPDSDSSTDHSWLPDTEEMYRTRQFLAQPAPQFHHSTDSDTESNNESEEPV